MWLKDIDRVRLQSDLQKEMNLRQDQKAILDLGSDERKVRKAVCSIGLPLPKPSARTVVV